VKDNEQMKHARQNWVQLVQYFQHVMPLMLYSLFTLFPFNYLNIL